MQTTQMLQEALAVPGMLRNQYEKNQFVLQDICARLNSYPPSFAVTVARGSSDHAAAFGKYLLETQLGLVTASAAPSVVTLYRAQLKLKNALVIAFSQSGQSPDIAEMMLAAREAGATTIALINQEDSLLVDTAEYIIPLHAGQENAVTATKSYLAMLGAFIQFISMMTQDPILQTALLKLPARLQEATQSDWSSAVTTYQNCRNTLVIARGFGFPVAQEAALKFKEAANIHAEAFSGAEFFHGPFTLIEKDFPLMLFGQRDASLLSILDAAKRAKKAGAKVLLAVPDHKDNQSYIDHDVASILLPLPKALHPICDPLLAIQAFYIMINYLSLARGLDPDQPQHLTKITKTR